MFEAAKTALSRLRDRAGAGASLYAIVATCLAMAYWLIGLRYQFHFADDGYLWYGAQRVLAGEIPLRDFRSYDPLRYYWAAGVMSVVRSQGMLAVNLACALAAAVGMWIATRLIFRTGPNRSWLLVLGTAAGFITWAASRMHFIDIAASIVLVASLGWMLEEPSRRRCFVAGLVLGVVAIVRRDHGLYGAVAEIAALAFVVLVERRARGLPSLVSWAAGGVVGYGPMLLAILLVPGFWTRFWSTLRVYFEIHATNRPLPVPWPWRAPFGHAEAIELTRFLLHGTLLIGLIAFGVAVVAVALRRALRGGTRLDPYLLAAGLLSILYAHHAFARAGIDHLVTAAFPMLIGAYIVVTRLPRAWALSGVAAMLVVSLLLLLPAHPLYQSWRDGDWVQTQVGADWMVVPPGVADRVSAVRALVQAYAPDGGELVALPLLSGAYPITGRRAAVWDTYAAFPADREVQQSEIARIQAERPTLVILERSDGPAGYGRTHPLVYDFILRNFTVVHPAGLPDGVRWDVYVPPGSGAATSAR